MTGKELFQIWAPTGKKWVDWVRPVSFVALQECTRQYSMSGFSVMPATYLSKDCLDAAILVDLPGAESVKEGLALAKVGFRPIPIYNGTIEQSGARATADNQVISIALQMGANELSKIDIPENALPAFLMDKNRLHRYKMEEAIFDNSWDVYPQDIPSAEYLWENGIRRVIIVSDTLSRDIKKLMYDYQKKKIAIWLTKGYEPPKKITIHRPLREERY